MDIRKALGWASVYNSFQSALGGNVRESFVREYLRPLAGQRLLDIGCGTADILDHLPQVEYVGFDSSEEYISAAQRRFGIRGQFHCRRVNASNIGEFGKFDLVLAHGVVHHLDDAESRHLFELAAAALASSGRLITLDGCFVDGQSRVARKLLHWDRGKHVRTSEAYQRLAGNSFENVELHVRHDLLRLPYTHIIMQCRDPIVQAVAADHKTAA